MIWLASTLAAAAALVAPAPVSALDLAGVDDLGEGLEAQLPVEVPSTDDLGSTVEDTVSRLNETVDDTLSNASDALPELGNDPPAPSGGDEASSPAAASPTAPAAAPAASAPTASAPSDPGSSTAQPAGSPAPGQDASEPAPAGAGGSDAAPAGTAAAKGASAAEGDRARRARARHSAAGSDRASDPPASPVGRLAESISELPSSVLLAMFALAGLGVAMAVRSAVLALGARRLKARQGELHADIGVLQSALVPELPDSIAGVGVSAAYRSCAGLAAGGDFLDVLELDEERIAVIVGDISGHDRDAVTVTALVHYTVRAYIAAGLQPRDALRLADRALGGRLGSHYATVLVAIYDGRESTLRYATAGHPPPIVLGGGPDHVVEALTPPPIGLGPPTGFRQTQIGVPAGAGVCLFTDGLVEARGAEGELLGREGLALALEGLGNDERAEELLARVLGAAAPRDDMTVCLLEPAAAAGSALVVEELELDRERAEVPALVDLLSACGLGADETDRARTAVAKAAGQAPVRLIVRRCETGASWSVDGSRPRSAADPGRPIDAQELGQYVQLVPNRI